MINQALRLVKLCSKPPLLYCKRVQICLQIITCLLHKPKTQFRRIKDEDYKIWFPLFPLFPLFSLFPLFPFKMQRSPRLNHASCVLRVMKFGMKESPVTGRLKMMQERVFPKLLYKICKQI